MKVKEEDLRFYWFSKSGKWVWRKKILDFSDVQKCEKWKQSGKSLDFTDVQNCEKWIQSRKILDFTNVQKNMEKECEVGIFYVLPMFNKCGNWRKSILIRYLY